MRAHEAEGPITRLFETMGESSGVSRRVSALASAHPETTSLSGPRSDDPHGNGSNRGVRVRIGLLSDGSYGIERWLEDGTRQVPDWVNA